MDRLALSFAEHGAIVTAIVRGEGDRARERMLAHLNIVESAAEAYVIDGLEVPPEGLRSA